MYILFALEFIIFFDHYYLLHKCDVGKRFGQHAYHHVYKYADQLNAFSGYSFAPQDGWSQGMPLALCTLFVPVPIAFVFTMEILTGLWTLYIHTDLCPLPGPHMGCDYHYIHHRYNWYNWNNRSYRNNWTNRHNRYNRSYGNNRSYRNNWSNRNNWYNWYNRF